MAHALRIVFGLGLLVSVTVRAEAQSRLTFPRVLSTQDLSTTGFALVNTSSSPAEAAFNFYSAAGLPVGSVTRTVPAKGQIAKLGSEILSGSTSSSWVQI